MGRAKIISGGLDGKYNIELVKDIRRITSALAAIGSRLAELPGLITQAQNDKNNAETSLNAARGALDASINAYILDNSRRGDVDAAQKAYVDAMSAYQTQKVKHSTLILEQETKTKEKKSLESASALEIKNNVWCADLTEDLEAGAQVGTMEINGESGIAPIIYPGGEDDLLPSSKLQPSQASTPAGVFYNTAVFPGWQKWKPTYRIAVILSVDAEKDTCSVCILQARSSAQGLNINQAGTEYSLEYTAGLPGWDDFKERNPSHPLVLNISETVLPMTEALMADLRSVNDDVNENYQYQLDNEQYVKNEYWTLMQPGGRGDCEDFALTKAQKLLDLGYPASALMIETGMHGQYGHAFLSVNTSSGLMSLDINYKDVLPSNNTEYTSRKLLKGGKWIEKGIKVDNVPIEYMDGLNAKVFAESDRVVVEFTDRDWSKPKVIGFESNPRGTGYITMLAVFREDASVVPNRMNIELYSIGETGALTLQKTIHHDPVHDLYSNGIIFTNALSWSIAKQKFISTAVVGTVPDLHVCVDEIALDGTKTSTLYDFNSPYYLSESPVQTGVHGTMDQPVFALQNAADITLTARGKVMTATDNLFHMMRICGLSPISEAPYYDLIKFKANMTEDFRRDGTLGIRYRTKEGAFIYYNDSGNTGTTAKTCFYIQAGKIHPATTSPDVPAYQDFLWTYGYQYLSSKWARLELRRTSIPVAALIANATINIETYPHTTVYTTTNADNRGGLAYLSEYDTYYFIKNVVLSGVYFRSQIYRCNNAGVPVSTEFFDSNNASWRDKVCEVLVSMSNAKLYGWA